MASTDDPTITTNLSTSRFFMGEKYEYEVSPDSKISPKSETKKSPLHTENEMVITETMVPVTKTIYLIRHAESDENRRLGSLQRILKGCTAFATPSKSDISASLELLNVPAQIDSDVSKIGRRQINQLGARLEKDNFLKEKGIQLVVHSPLKRARQTSEGMLKSVAPRSDVGAEEDSSAVGTKASSIERVVELPVLKERTPMEWLPINHDSFTKRIAEFEKWIGEQPEDVIAVVGHSQYFKSMLGLQFKFGNCDVWSLQFDSSITMSHKSVKEDINIAESIEQKRKLKERLSDSLTFATAHFKTDKDREEKNLDEKLDDTPLEASSLKNDKKENENIEEVELPRGWRKLKNLYSFDENLE